MRWTVSAGAYSTDGECHSRLQTRKASLHHTRARVCVCVCVHAGEEDIQPEVKRYNRLSQTGRAGHHKISKLQKTCFLWTRAPFHEKTKSKHNNNNNNNRIALKREEVSLLELPRIVLRQQQQQQQQPSKTNKKRDLLRVFSLWSAAISPRGTDLCKRILQTVKGKSNRKRKLL